MIGKVTENFDVLISRAQKFQSWWSFSTCSGDKLDIAACRCAGVSEASQALENGISDIRNLDLDLAVVLALRLEEAEMAPQIDQGGALVVQLELDALLAGSII